VKSYMSKTLNYPYLESLQINLMSLAVATCSIPIGAWMSDKYGRKPVMKYTAISIIVFMYPIFWLLGQVGIEAAVLSQLIFSALVGFYMGPIPAVLVEMFPTRVRFTGVSVSYNTSVAIFGGTAPLVGTWLVSHTRHDFMALYVAFFVVITVITLKYYRETYRSTLV